MVIVKPGGGLGNQMDQYAVGRCLAYKLNTEFKLNINQFNTSPEFIRRTHTSYRLGDFNILENFATPEEVKRVMETGTIPTSVEELENIQGDVYIQGHWLHKPELYKDIADIIRKEFTLKRPFNPTAEIWRRKIMSAECSVSLHFRFGDYLYNPNRTWFPVLPFDYYRTCIDILKYRYNTPPNSICFRAKYAVGQR